MLYSLDGSSLFFLHPNNPTNTHLRSGLIMPSTITLQNATSITNNNAKTSTSHTHHNVYHGLTSSAGNNSILPTGVDLGVGSAASPSLLGVLVSPVTGGAALLKDFANAKSSGLNGRFSLVNLTRALLFEDSSMNI